MEVPAPQLAAALGRWMQAQSHAVVCLSGGVDSAVLAAAARQWLGARALAVTGVSDSLAAEDRRRAQQLCARLGLAHVEVHTLELERADYAANSPTRCFFCKSELFARVRGALPAAFAPAPLLEGTHLDDLEGHRPGHRAAAEAGVLSPYLELGWRKAQVRAVAEALGLPPDVVQRPSSPCLSSRLPFGTPVTRQRLAQIEAAEAELHRRGYGECRVRHHGSIARIELPAGCMAQFLERDAREVARHLRQLGFAYTTLDVLGLRSGSMHEELAPPTRRGLA